jgi:hypothetical protein
LYFRKVDQHCRDDATDIADESDAHLTVSVPPLFSALHVPVHVTMHDAPDPHVTVDPAPTVTVQALWASHCTEADAPAANEHIACAWQSRLELSVAVTEQLLEEHVVSHDDPHEPVHDAPAVQENEHPLVVEPQAPLPFKLHAPPFVQEQFVPVHDAGAAGPPPEPPEPEHPHAASNPTTTRADFNK